MQKRNILTVVNFANPLFLISMKILKYTIIIIILSALGYGIWYSVEQYNLAAENITVCTDSGCIRTMHTHSDLDLSICGTKIQLPREVWALNSLHTHKEKNYLHFHDKVPLRADGSLTPDTRLTLEHIFETFDIDTTQMCGQPLENLELTVLINGEPAVDGLGSLWKDHDIISINVK